MREIKFRAWDKVTKQMCYLWEINWKTWDINSSIINYVVIETDGTVEREEHEIELMQYTGLKDKNGKEIYEGDIGKTNFLSYRIVFDLGCFQCLYSDDKFAMHLYSIAADLEIIGNVFENSELLK